MIRRRLVPAVAVATMAATALAACSGSSTGDGGSGKGSTLTYWASNMSSSVQQDAAVRKAEFAKFTRQTGIHVKVQVIDWGSLYQRILTAVGSDQGPDVLEIGNTWAVPLQATGAFLPFGAAQFAAIGGKSRFLASTLQATGAAGKDPTSIPLFGLSYGLLYNKKLFTAAHISHPPATWAELVADAKRLTKPGQWGMALDGGSAVEGSHFAFILGRQNGASLFKGDKATFDTPQEVAAFKQYLALMATDKVVSPSNAEYDSTEPLTDIASGKVAMVISQTESVAAFAKTYKANAADFAIAQVPVLSPLPAGGRPVETHAAGINVSVFKNTSHQQAALELVKFLTSDAEQVALNKTFGSLPVISAAYRDPAFQRPEIKVLRTVLADHAEPMPLVEGEGQMETLLGGAMKSLFAKVATKGSVSDADIRAALKNAQQQMAAAGH
jgi:multiple sugar transport system substrate-binding protein